MQFQVLIADTALSLLSQYYSYNNDYISLKILTKTRQIISSFFVRIHYLYQQTIVSFIDRNEPSLARCLAKYCTVYQQITSVHSNLNPPKSHTLHTYTQPIAREASITPSSHCPLPLYTHTITFLHAWRARKNESRDKPHASPEVNRTLLPLSPSHTHTHNCIQVRTLRRTYIRIYSTSFAEFGSRYDERSRAARRSFSADTLGGCCVLHRCCFRVCVCVCARLRKRAMGLFFVPAAGERDLRGSVVFFSGLLKSRRWARIGDITLRYMGV